MAPSKTKVAKPKEVSLETPPKTDFPKVEIPNTSNDELVTSTIPDFLVASEEQREVPITTVWDHAIENLFKLSTVHPDGKSLQLWAK